MTFMARIDDLSSSDAQSLVIEHLQGMHSNSPPGHVNALAIDGLRQPEVTFWTVWQGSALCGCGALKELDSTTGEIKSMRTRAAYLRQGVGQFVLDEILGTALARGYRRLCLETGTGPAFEAAHTLYRKNGFEWCGAFGDYVATEFNVFMARPLQTGAR
jgi:putative acetyltransferase